jgi:hypothetical protein
VKQFIRTNKNEFVILRFSEARTLSAQQRGYLMNVLYDCFEDRMVLKSDADSWFNVFATSLQSLVEVNQKNVLVITDHGLLGEGQTESLLFLDSDGVFCDSSFVESNSREELVGAIREQITAVADNSVIANYPILYGGQKDPKKEAEQIVLDVLRSFEGVNVNIISLSRVEEKSELLDLIIASNIGKPMEIIAALALENCQDCRNGFEPWMINTNACWVPDVKASLGLKTSKGSLLIAYKFEGDPVRVIMRQIDSKAPLTIGWKKIEKIPNLPVANLLGVFVDEYDVTVTAMGMINKRPRPLNPGISNFDIPNAKLLRVVKLKVGGKEMDVIEVPKGENILRYIKQG